MISNTVLAEQNVHVDDLLVTDGSVEVSPEGSLHVRSKEMRATLKSATPQKVAVAFTYLGPTEEVSRLGNGEVRHQFGLKLRAQDTCNVIYVMWHFDIDDNRIHISVKSNPGKSTFAACKDQGYINNIKPQTWHPPKSVSANEKHTLSAELNDDVLTVTADGVVAWKGILPPVVKGFSGPIGVRSDNARVLFDVKVTP